jgi:hypothetical protein
MLALAVFLAASPVGAQTQFASSPDSSSGTTLINGPTAAVTPPSEQVMYFRKEAQPAAPASPPVVVRPTRPVRLPVAQQPAPRGRSAVRLAQLQGEGRRPVAGDTSLGTNIPLGPPGPDYLFQRDSEKSLMERMRQKALDQNERIIFPEEPVISRDTYTPRSFPLAVEVVEPNYLCHKRLLFEDLNSERYDWDLGIIQPVVSLGLFYKDIVLWPYHYFTRPCECYECSAGYCLPGDPVPYLCYPPEISVTGAIAEAGVVAGLFAAFP